MVAEDTRASLVKDTLEKHIVRTAESPFVELWPDDWVAVTVDTYNTTAYPVENVAANLDFMLPISVFIFMVTIAISIYEARKKTKELKLVRTGNAIPPKEEESAELMKGENFQAVEPQKVVPMAGPETHPTPLEKFNQAEGGAMELESFLDK